MSRCQSCRRDRPIKKHQLLLKLFPSSGPFKSVKIDIPVPLMPTKLVYRFEVVMIDRITKRTRPIFMVKITSPNVATVVSENCVILYRSPDIVHRKSGKQFKSKFLQLLRFYQNKIRNNDRISFAAKRASRLVQRNSGCKTATLYRGKPARLGKFCTVSDLCEQHAIA